MKSRTIGSVFILSFAAIFMSHTLFAAELVVSNSNNSGPGSLRDTIGLASQNDTIVFDSSVVGPINLNKEITIKSNVSIHGPTDRRLVITGSKNNRVFYIEPGAKVLMSNLTISGGNGCNCNLGGENQGSDNSNPKWDGGGINNKGDLTLIACTLSDNSTTANHGGSGGAVSNDLNAKLTIINSTISGNSTKDGGQGGGIYNKGMLFVTNSTIAYNKAPLSTGGIYNEGSAHIANSIIAGNLRGTIQDDFYSNGLVESNGFNFVGVGITGNSSDLSFAGTSASISDIIMPLADNGGPTHTHALSLSSPAIDAGNTADALDQLGNALATDQRGSGYLRVANNRVDIGSFESMAMSSELTCTPNPQQNGAALINAIKNAQPGATVVLSDSCLGKEAVLPAPIELEEGTTITIVGPESTTGEPGFDLASQFGSVNLKSNLLSISGDNTSELFNIRQNAVLNAENLRFMNAFSASSGAAITNEGVFNANRVLFEGNRIANSISNDLVGGAALFNVGSVNIRNALFADNEVRSNSLGRAAGGAIYHLRGDMNLSEVSFLRNSVSMDASASALDIARAQGAAVFAAARMNFENILFEDNSAIARSESLRGAQALGGAMHVQVMEQDAIRLRQVVMSRNFARAEAIREAMDINEMALAEGGALYIEASSFALRMSDMQFIDNQALASNMAIERDAFARGAAIANYGKLESENNFFRRNEAIASSLSIAFAEAAAMFSANNAVASMSFAEFSDNSARAITNISSTSQAIARGAAISAMGSVSLRSSSFSSNSVRAENFAEPSNLLRPVAQAFGAAMFIGRTSSSSLLDSSMDNNVASANVRNLGQAMAYGAAFANEGQFDLRQSTLYRNSALTEGDSFLRAGGGAYNAQGADLSIRNSTFANNLALTGANLFNAGDMLVRNSAFAYPAIGTNFSLAESSAINALSSFNFADDQSGMAFAKFAADLKLNDFTDNGGFSYTMMPKRESILVDGGDFNFDCWQNFDQRGIGFQRCSGIPKNGEVRTGPIDVGAVELSQCLNNSQCATTEECQNRVCYVATQSNSTQCTDDIAFTYSRDSDGDGVGDNSHQVRACSAPAGYVVAGAVSDNCPTKYNPDQKDSNNNGIGDVCEAVSSGCNSTDTTGSNSAGWTLLLLAALLFGLRFRKSAATSTLAIAFFTVPLAFAQTPKNPKALAQLQDIAETEISINDATGAPSFIRLKKAKDGEASPQAAVPAKQKAQAFLNTHAKAFGLKDSSDLAFADEKMDSVGGTHLTYAQKVRGVTVFGAELKLHFDPKGNLTAINGTVIPDVQLNTTPSFAQDKAHAVALKLVAYQKGALGLFVEHSELMVHRTGLPRGIKGHNYLVWKLEVTNKNDVREFVFVDAHSGKIIDQITGTYEALHRKLYNGTEAYKAGETFWEEGGSFPADASDKDKEQGQALLDYTKNFYDFFNNTFGWDSFDGKGGDMLAVFNRSEGCPNASWNGTYLSVCPVYMVDDVVGHEWGHAVINRTNKLVYQWEPGALNESYADIWGELVDLTNGSDRQNLDLNTIRDDTCPCTADSLGNVTCEDGKTNRWLMAEDNYINTDAGAVPDPLRDMHNPVCLRNPGEVRGQFYWCSEGDFGGVHTNSGVPNRAFALLADGYVREGGESVPGIGFVKAAHIYWTAQSAIEGPYTNFKEHADALEQACEMLKGDTQLLDFNGVPSGQKISAQDCAKVSEVSDLVKLRVKPCQTLPLLDPFNTPPISCPRAVHVFDFLDGEQGFTTVEAYTGDNSKLDNFTTTQKWKRVTNLPDSWMGAGFFAPNPNEGSSTAGEDASNKISLISPELEIPNSNSGKIILTFDQNIGSEAGYDGGNVKVSEDNGITWTLLAQDAFIFNGYNQQLKTEENTNPMKGEPAFTGADAGELGGSWSQSQADLTKYKGKNIKLRFDFGMDVGTGVIGWYVTNINIYNTDPELTVATTCGEGFCANTGVETCNSSGRLTNSCIEKPPVTLFGDADGDGIGSPTQGTLTRCVAPEGYVLASAGVDNCPTVKNPDQRDSNNNGVGDACVQAVVQETVSGGCNMTSNLQPNARTLASQAILLFLLLAGLSGLRARKKRE